VCLRWKLTGVFQESMELEKFPLDYQDLTITLVSWYEKGSKSFKVELIKNQSSKYRSTVDEISFLQRQEYLLYPNLSFYQSVTLASMSTTALVYPRLDVRMRVDRFPWPWMSNVGGPCSSSRPVSS
jgi:hypothetical protein